MTPKRKSRSRLFILSSLLAFALSACSPHPGAGIWKAEGENSLGIKSMTLTYEGRAEFSSTKGEPARWHCFWNGASKRLAHLDCTPSTNTETHERFEFTVGKNGVGELRRQGKAIGRFLRQAGNPSPR